MRKIFTEPKKPEELYEFFTYGLPLHSMDWTYRWCSIGILNHIKRRLWCVRIVRYAKSISMDYQPGYKETDDSWYIHAPKYLPYVHKQT